MDRQFIWKSPRYLIQSQGPTATTSRSSKWRIFIHTKRSKPSIWCNFIVFSTNFRWLLARDHLLAHHLHRLLKHSSQNAKLVYNFESLSLDTRHGFGVIHFIVLASISMQQPHVFMASSQKASNSSPSSTSGGFFHLRWGNEWRLVNYNLGMITYWAQWKAS